MISYLLRGNVFGVIADLGGPTRPAQIELVNPKPLYLRSSGAGGT
jgi:hypothetical protein